MEGGGGGGSQQEVEKSKINLEISFLYINLVKCSSSTTSKMCSIARWNTKMINYGNYYAKKLKQTDTKYSLFRSWINSNRVKNYVIFSSTYKFIFQRVEGIKIIQESEVIKKKKSSSKGSKTSSSPPLFARSFSSKQLPQVEESLERNVGNRIRSEN